MTDLNKERELFEEAYLSVGGKQRDLELEDGEYTNSKAQLGWELWQIKAKDQAVPEGYVLVTEDQAKDAARLDFMLKEHRVICTDTNYDENYELTDEGFCVNEVYWIDGWDRLTETVHQTKREAIDKAMEASESGAQQ
ncbi:hypothetical protein QM259_12165 [Acinetobacter baumannii]|uniref:hypothetical protein n=1 Tax=Acinetobacter baumannii TaxID=470 RepID=UPI0024B7697C|nr:hypothetical protein [Acinetobacter baumannii]MDI9733040.1 hypothetical protein [Acinetobacter baumannii]